MYGSRDAFVSAIAPFVREGIRRGDTTLVVTSCANADAVREELGTDARLVRFEDADGWYRNPGTTLAAYRDVIDAAVAGGAPGVRLVGEPVWRGSRAAQREWARYESVLNIALAADPVSIVCPYDATRLPDSVLVHALETHPSFADERGGTSPSPYYVPPGTPMSAPGGREGIRESFGVALTEPRELADLRFHVAREARDAGVTVERLGGVVLAASEIAGNAIRHGESPVVARMGTLDGDFVVEVCDGGRGIGDPLAGWLPAESTSGGWGLVLARRLSDAVDICRKGRRSCIRLHFQVAPETLG